MTTSENAPKPLLDPFLASILTASVNWSNDLSDQVIADKDREITDWKNRFLNLWEDMQKENRSVDSLRIQIVINDYSHYAGIAARDLDTH
jgi:hypothetical protein